MLNPFGTKAKLLRLVEKLSFYNDKGIAYKKHSAEQVSEHRAACMERISLLSESIGKENLPSEFVQSIGTAELSEELEGHYFRILRVHFENLKKS